MTQVPLVTTKRTGLVDQVIGQMRELIATGEWPLGRRIPPEAELVTALGVGRNTVREAVRALSHSGVLEVRQGDGTFVSATNELSGAVRRLCGPELRQVYEVRRALEVEGARLAATARQDSDVTALDTQLRARNRALAAHDFEQFVATDAAFHQLLVKASHNPVLIGMYEGISEAVLSSVATSFGLETAEKTVSHDELFAAVRDGDPAKAAAEAGGFLEELLAQLPADSDRQSDQ